MKRLLMLLAAVLFPLAANATLKTAVVQAAAATVDGNTVDFTSANAGFSSDVKAAICTSTRATANDTDTGNIRHSFGFAADNGGVTQSVIHFSGRDAYGSGDEAAVVGSSSRISSHGGSTGGTDGYATATFLSTGIRLTFTDGFSQAELVNCMLIGGDVEANVMTGNFPAASPNNLDLTHGLSGSPDVLVMIEPGSNSSGRFGFYAATGPTKAGLYWKLGTTGTPTDVATRRSITDMGPNFNASFGAITVGDIAYNGSTQVRMNQSLTSATDSIYVLALRSTTGTPLVAKAGTVGTPTSIGTAAVVSGMSAEPAAIIQLGTIYNTLDADSATGNASVFTVGMAAQNSGTDQMYARSFHKDNVATSITRDRTSATKVLDIPDTNGADDVFATISSWDSGGVTNDYSAVAGSAYGILYLAFGEGVDLIPDAFFFVDKTNQPINTVTTSAGVTIGGLGAGAAATYTISGSGCTGAINGGTYSTSPGTVVNTDVITLRVTSSSLPSTQVDCVASVGTAPTTDTFSVTTTAVAAVSATTVRLLADVFAGSGAVTAHAPDNGITDGDDDVAGFGWTLADFVASFAHSTATISGGSLSVPLVTAVIADVGSPNQVVDVDWTPPAGATTSNAHLFLRYSNSANFWAVGYTVGGTSCGGAYCNYFQPFKVVGGVTTTYPAMSLTSSPALPVLTLGTTYRILAAANGNNLAFGVYAGGAWYITKVTDAALNTVTKAGVGNGGLAGGSYTDGQIYDNLNIMQSFASTDATTLRKAADPDGFFAGLTIPVGTFHWMAPRTQIDHIPVDLQFYCCGSWYIDPEAAYVGQTVWGIERYNPTTSSISATTHTHTTLETGAGVAPTLSAVPDQTCPLNTDPGPLNIAGLYLSNPLTVVPAPTYSFSAGATGLVMTSGRTLNATTGIITGLCTSTSGSPVTTTIVATNATGSASRTFTQTVTTLTDAVPNPFGWAAQSDVALSAAIDSEAVTITGYDTAPAITISAGEYSINAGAFTSAPGVLAVGDTVTVRVTSSGSNATVTTATVTIGGVSGTFSVTTTLSTPASTDTIPTQFSIADAAGVPISSTIPSAQFTVLGIDAASTIGIAGGGQYEKNNSGNWTSAIGTVVLNDKVRVRGTSAATANTAVNIALSIGGVIDTFTITTAAGASCTNIPNQRITRGGTIRVDFNGYCTGVTSFSGTAVGGLIFDQGVLSGEPLSGHWVQHFTADGPQGSFPVGVTIDVFDPGSSGVLGVIRHGIRR